MYLLSASLSSSLKSSSGARSAGSDDAAVEDPYESSREYPFTWWCGDGCEELGSGEAADGRADERVPPMFCSGDEERLGDADSSDDERDCECSIRVEIGWGADLSRDGGEGGKRVERTEFRQRGPRAWNSRLYELVLTWS